MDPNTRPFMTGGQGQPGGGRNTGDQREGQQGRGNQTEGLVDQAADAARKVYDEGGRYLREGWESLPDMDRYVSRPVQENPLIGIAVAAAVGYLIAYLIHGSDSHWSRSGVPDYARMRDYGRSRY